MAVNNNIYQSKANNASKWLYYARAAYRESVGLVQRRPLPPLINKKRVTPKNDSFNVVPPGIEPWTQGQFIDNVSPLLYRLGYGTYIQKKGVTLYE